MITPAFCAACTADRSNGESADCSPSSSMLTLMIRAPMSTAYLMPRATSAI
jgi:hypothetical protein